MSEARRPESNMKCVSSHAQGMGNVVKVFSCLLRHEFKHRPMIQKKATPFPFPNFVNPNFITCAIRRTPTWLGVMQRLPPKQPCKCCRHYIVTLWQFLFGFLWGYYHIGCGMNSNNIVVCEPSYIHILTYTLKPTLPQIRILTHFDLPHSA